MKAKIIEMLDRGEYVELECIDKDGFINSSGGWYKTENEKILSHVLTVERCVQYVDAIEIAGCAHSILDSELKYFKIKEPEYTFDDLIDVAVQAAKDGILHVREITSDSLRFSKVDGLRGNSYYYCSSKYLGGIEHIKSLYFESFIIESEEDMCRISGECEIVLTNGESIGSIVTISNGTPYFEYDGRLTPVPYAVLKGASVTQKRGA